MRTNGAYFMLGKGRMMNPKYTTMIISADNLNPLHCTNCGKKLNVLVDMKEGTRVSIKCRYCKSISRFEQA